MARGRTKRVMVGRTTAEGARSRLWDHVVVEEPMEIHLDGHLVATTMRTPGADYELAVGFCHGDGLLHSAPVAGVRYCALGSADESGYNVVTVDTGGVAPEPAPRLTTTSSSCGWCGSQPVDDLVARLASRPGPPVELDPAVIVAAAGAVAADQEVFARTGGLHAAAAFDLATGAVAVVREDIGRHNAVDKVVGRLLLDGRLPADGLGLWISGRASFEMVQKAWAGGFAAVVSVSAASSLAIDVARRAGITLAGFARDGGFVTYT